MGEIGSRPCLPVLESVKFGLLPLVISAKTHRIELVVLPQAKLTWLGSDATLGFSQAVVICCWTVATLAGQEGLDLKISTDATMITARAAATPNTILRERGRRTRLTLRRPRSMMAWVRSSAPGPRCPDSDQPPAWIGVVKSSSKSSSTKCLDWFWRDEPPRGGPAGAVPAGPAPAGTG